MSRLCCAGPPFEPFDGGLKRITTDRATGACRGSRGHWPGFSPAGMLKDGVFPSPNRPQSLHSLNLMSEPHLPSGPELCPKPAPGFCSRCRKSFSGSFGLAICPTCGDRLIPEGYCPVWKDYRSFWYTRYFPNSFCGICLTHQNAVTKVVIHPGYNLGYNSGEHRAPRYGSPPSLFRQRYCPCMGQTLSSMRRVSRVRCRWQE